MSLAYPSAPAARFIRLVDLAMLAWIAGWIVYGLAVHQQVRRMSALSDTLVRTGQAVDGTAQALRPLRSLPFVGGRLGSLVERAHEVALSAEASGETSRDAVSRLAVELGLAIALVPTVPLVAIYAPLRLARVREVAAIRARLRQGVADPTFVEFLAHRAAERLPYHALRGVSANPWRDLESGRHEALARAELRRLGFRRIGPLVAPEGARADGT